MKDFYIYLGIFISLAVSRFIPHPPNFTSLLALSFYIPTILGLRFLPALILSFVITDFFIGYHNLTHWTWGSVLLIGFLSQFIKRNYIFRIIGALAGAFIFFIITNFGVWASGAYGYHIPGLIQCYTLAIPFFTSSLISTLLFSLIIEFVVWSLKLKKLLIFRL
tara:strand:+ start:60 stop:551 length:492 start_codon:yes stop_codon:yes gene_type:complete